MTTIVYILNGPNLNLLGTREPEVYGRATLTDVEKLCRETAKHHRINLEFRQMDSELAHGDRIVFIPPVAGG